jgi:CRISPR-associated endonuclease/helicase Cas3
MEQTLEEHLCGVASRSRRSAEKFGLADFGELLGLLHDLGKYSRAFQDYIRLPDGRNDQDADDAAGSRDHARGALRGKIDHSTAGAQAAWRRFGAGERDFPGRLLAQIVSLSLASHHSGLIDCIDALGEDVFTRRMNKADALTHLSEITPKIQSAISRRIDDLFEIVTAPGYFDSIVRSMLRSESEKGAMGRFKFKAGLLLRMLFSCLIDADRSDTIDFERHGSAALRQEGEYADWGLLLQRLEDHVGGFGGGGSVNEGRAVISDCCRAAAERDRGFFTLTVPTGGGKTLASLRFALRHAEKHGFDRIFYIVPYTSIIDQNAEEVRKILEKGSDSRGKIVLECHSNLSSERSTWRGKVLSENWDAPVVFTTSVQFLESLFAGGTRSVRRAHQLAKSIIIFDEIQTIPIRVVHMFCNSLNFLVEQCGSSVVLCTATQPLLNGVNKERGALNYSREDEIVPDVGGAFEVFERTKVIYMLRPRGYSNEEIAEMAVREREAAGTTLVIMNTTKAAKEVYRFAKERFNDAVHLSARMCPAHRSHVLGRIRKSLDADPQVPLICVATQVIEAGVDVDFGSAIRSLAGLDSIIQAAGRANRHGRRGIARVLLVNSNEENVMSLTDIKEGADATRKIFQDLNAEIASGDDMAITPGVMDSYFEQYFYKRAESMVYPVNEVRADSLLRMLSTNDGAVNEYAMKNNGRSVDLPLPQSFAAASGVFRAIEAPGSSVIVPYERGEDVIAGLCGEFQIPKNIQLLREAQRYSVNVYPQDLKELMESGAVYEINTSSGGEPLGLWALRDSYYSDEFGLSGIREAKMKPLGGR